MSTSKREKGLFVTLSLIILFLSSCADAFPFGLTDEKLENISLEKAQSLVPFTICLPTYLPDDVNSEPYITYNADWGDPVESQIRLRYSLLLEEKPVIEIYEIHNPGVTTGLEVNRSKNSQTGAIRGLLDWQIADNSEIDSYLQEIEMSSAHNEAQGTVWWFIEISDPPKLRSIMVDWLDNPVYYVIYTFLPKNEIENIALSMIKSCNQ